MSRKYEELYLYIPPEMGEVVFIASGETEEELAEDCATKLDAYQNGDDSGLQKSVKANIDLVLDESTERWAASGREVIKHDRALHQIVIEGCVVSDLTEFDEAARKARLKAEFKNRLKK